MHLGAWRINEYGEKFQNDGGWGVQGRVVARFTFTARKLTTFVIGHSDLDTMVNDYGGYDTEMPV